MRRLSAHRKHHSSFVLPRFRGCWLPLRLDKSSLDRQRDWRSILLLCCSEFFLPDLEHLIDIGCNAVHLGFIVSLPHVVHLKNIALFRGVESLNFLVSHDVAGGIEKRKNMAGFF